jgi:hypothetical protein
MSIQTRPDVDVEMGMDIGSPTTGRILLSLHLRSYQNTHPTPQLFASARSLSWLPASPRYFTYATGRHYSPTPSASWLCASERTPLLILRPLRGTSTTIWHTHGGPMCRALHIGPLQLLSLDVEVQNPQSLAAVMSLARKLKQRNQCAASSFLRVQTTMTTTPRVMARWRIGIPTSPSTQLWAFAPASNACAHPTWRRHSTHPPQLGLNA